jgi:hypothetical protein
MADKPVWTLKDFSRLNIVAIRPSRRPLVTFTSEYTHTNAYNLALLSSLAYADASKVKTFFEQAAEIGIRSFSYGDPKISGSPLFDEDDIACKFTFTDQSFHSDPVTDTQFYIVHNANQLILSVRGTEPKSGKDWFQDSKATQVDFKEGKGQVHLGFYQGFKFLKPYLDKYIKDNVCSTKEFIVTGHSLGAAVATIAAAYLRETLSNKVMLYTYGSPRVGNKTFADRYSGSKAFTYYRIVNGSDVVTMVPLPGMDLKPHLLPLAAGASFLLPLITLDWDGDLFTHLGKMVHIDAMKNGGVIQNQTANAARLAILMIPPALILGGAVTLKMLLGIKECVTDHFMTSYMPILTKMLKLVIKSYLDIDSVEFSGLEADIKTLEKQVADLKTSEANLLAQAKTYEEEALKTSNGPTMQAWNAAEAAKLRLQAAELNFIIADKKVDLAHYRGTITYYKDRANNKQRYLNELIGTGFYKSSMESEFSYHANN